MNPHLSNSQSHESHGWVSQKGNYSHTHNGPPGPEEATLKTGKSTRFLSLSLPKNIVLAGKHGFFKFGPVKEKKDFRTTIVQPTQEDNLSKPFFSLQSRVWMGFRLRRVVQSPGAGVAVADGADSAGGGGLGKLQPRVPGIWIRIASDRSIFFGLLGFLDSPF